MIVVYPNPAPGMGLCLPGCSSARLPPVALEHSMALQDSHTKQRFYSRHNHGPHLGTRMVARG